jgi:prephenate dehydrogenase
VTSGPPGRQPDPPPSVPDPPPRVPDPPASVPDSPASVPDPPASVVVIGAGLIGTSIALALRGRGSRVWLSDRDRAAARLAQDMGAGELLPEAGTPGGPADVAVLAVPPSAVAGELAAAQARGLARSYTDVASVKALPLSRAAELGCDLASYVPGHPLSGRERSGPAAARADLFLGRPWVLCPGPPASPAALTAVTGLVLGCGAQLMQLSAAQHDRWVALVSHVPHVVSSAMAARLLPAPDGALVLAGQGLRDVTRIAAGDIGLWTQILTANARPASDILAQIGRELEAAAQALARVADGDGEALKQLTDLLDRGASGVARIPGKRGGPASHYVVVQVVIPDRPGELARLFEAAGQAGINIEDVAIEHSPGLPVGVAELSVRPEEAQPLTTALAAGGWPVRQ